MEIKNILGEKRYSRYFQHHKPEDFENHGLGWMSKKERSELLELGAIITINDVDIINCDGWCVNTYKDDEGTCVFEGSKFACLQEMEKIKNIKPNAKVKVRNYPKAYFEYYQAKRDLLKAEEYEEMALDSLAQNFGGEVIN